MVIAIRKVVQIHHLTLTSLNRRDGCQKKSVDGAGVSILSRHERQAIADRVRTFYIAYHAVPMWLSIQPLIAV